MKIESEADLRGMKRIGEICGLTLKLLLDSAEAGMSTRDLDDIGIDFLTKIERESQRRSRLSSSPAIPASASMTRRRTASRARTASFERATC